MAKHILESAEVCSAYAILDWCHYELERLLRENNKDLSRPPVARLIDQATGYDKKLRDDARERLKYTAELFKEIVKNKKIVGLDYSDSEKTLKELRKQIRLCDK